MREADRPVEERVSVFDRPATAADALPTDGPHAHVGRGLEIDPSTLRLAATSGNVRLYVARGLTEDTLAQMVLVPMGGGGSAGRRWALAECGALVGTMSASGLGVTHGIVPDSVLAVRVGDVDAVLGENGFLAVGTSSGDAVTLITADGVRRIDFLPWLPPLRPEGAVDADSAAYDGMVEYAQRGFTRVVIDDLDDPRWTATLGSFVFLGPVPDAQTVDIVLLEGPRAGELATADLVVHRDGDRHPVDAELVGRTGFGPHPDPRGLEAALDRYREIQRRTGGSRGSD